MNVSMVCLSLSTENVVSSVYMTITSEIVVLRMIGRARHLVL
jgi:hypothetical protein